MPDSESKPTLSYNQEDIQQILQLAIARQTYDGEFSRQQLLEIAAELEISSDNLQLAEKEWQARQGELAQRQAFNSYRLNRLKKHAGNFAIVNTFLILINLVGSGTVGWALYVLLFWGLGLGLQTWSAFQSGGEDYDRAFEKWSRKHQFKQVVNTFFSRLLNN
jgi:hypothetical protein